MTTAERHKCLLGDLCESLSETSSGCWVWLGKRLAAGYGIAHYTSAGRAVLAHRLAYTLACGVIPVGAMVCHRCDNPPCCNPSHLFIGDAGANVRDCIQKGHASWYGRRSGPRRPGCVGLEEFLALQDHLDG